MTQETLHKTKQWLSKRDNQLLVAEWAARLIGWKIGVGGLLAIPFKFYRKAKGDENRGSILIKNGAILMRIWNALGDSSQNNVYLHM